MQALAAEPLVVGQPEGLEMSAASNIRRLRPEDAAALVSVRREALTSDPLAFSASTEDDRALSLEPAFAAGDASPARSSGTGASSPSITWFSTCVKADSAGAPFSQPGRPEATTPQPPRASHPASRAAQSDARARRGAGRRPARIVPVDARDLRGLPSP